MMFTKKFKVISAAILLVLILGLFFCIGMNAKANDGRVTAKHYQKIQVMEGDTLWSIAEEYCPEELSYKEFIADVRRTNSLGEVLYSGYYIYIPYYTESIQ